MGWSPQIIFSIYRPTVLKRESSPPLLHIPPKFLAHDEKHKFPCCVVVLQSFNEKKLEVRAASCPLLSHTNPHKVSVRKKEEKLPKKRNVETIYCCYFVSVDLYTLRLALTTAKLASVAKTFRLRFPSPAMKQKKKDCAVKKKKKEHRLDVGPVRYLVEKLRHLLLLR